jgi:hypothetical protein
MPARKPRPQDEKPQFERFLETVRQTEAGETDEELDKAVRKMLPPKKTTKATAGSALSSSRRSSPRGRS